MLQINWSIMGQVVSKTSGTQSYANLTRELENVLMNKVNGKSISLSIGSTFWLTIEIKLFIKHDWRDRVDFNLLPTLRLVSKQQNENILY